MFSVNISLLFIVTSASAETKIFTMENLVELIQQKLYRNHSRGQIKEVLYMVRELNPLDPPEQLVDLVVDMLTDEQPFCNNLSPVCTQEALWESELDGAVGFGRSNIFSCSANELDEMNTFPACLKKRSEKLVGQTSIIENNGLTSRQDFLTGTEENTTGFDFQQFFEMFPDPERFFGNPNKENPLGSPEVSQEDIDYALTFLYNRYRKIRKRHIHQVFERMQKRLYDCCLYLDKFPVEMRRERQTESSSGSKNADLLLEITYLTHQRFLRYHFMYKNQS